MSKKLLIIIVPVVLLLGGGGAGYFFFFAHGPAPETEVTNAPAPPVFLPLDPLSVPLPRPDKPPLYHFVTLTLQTTEQEKGKLVEMMPRLRDAWLRDLNAHPVGRRDEPTELDLDLLKTRILQQTEKVMGGPLATDVLIVRTARGAG